MTILPFLIIIIITILIIRALVQPVVLVVRFCETRALPAPRVGVETFLDALVSWIYVGE